MSAYRCEIEAFVAERAAEFEVELPCPWESALSSSDFPRPLLEDLCVAAVATRAAEQLQANTALSLHDAIDEARNALPQPSRLCHDRQRVVRRARALVLRAQMRSAALPEGIPEPLASCVRALQSHWEARTAALDRFARDLDAITREHGSGLGLSAASARECQNELNAAAYAELRLAFVDNHSSGMVRLDLKDEEIQSLLLESDAASVALFTPMRAFALLHAHFGTVAEDLVRQQTADAFVDAFWLRQDTELRSVRGKVAVELRVWIDAFDKAHYKRVRYSHDCRSRIEKGLRALTEIWLHGRGAGDGQRASAELQACLQSFIDAEWSPGPALKPRLLGVELRCFQNRIDCLIPEAFAGEINAFVTLHSKRLLDRLG